SAMRDHTHGQLVSPNLFLRQGRQDGIAESSMGIVVFDGNDNPACGPRRGDQFVAIDRLNAEQVDDPDGNVLFLKLLIRCQSLEDRDAACNNECPVPVALSKDLAFTNLKRFVPAVENRGLWSSQAQVARA